MCANQRQLTLKSYQTFEALIEANQRTPRAEYNASFWFVRRAPCREQDNDRMKKVCIEYEQRM
jgi:hypothetical protein